MTNQTHHIHDIIHLVADNGKFNSVEEFHQSIKAKFGTEAMFVSCSKVPFGIDEVVDFLTKRNKITLHDDNSITLHPEMTMCDGHEHH